MKIFKLALCAVILFAATPPLRAQNQQDAPSAQQTSRRVDARQQKMLRSAIKNWQAQLDACTPQTCDDAERFVLDRNIQFFDVVLGNTSSPQFEAARKGFQDLQKKHPEYHRNMPNETPSEKQARQTREKEQAVLKEKAKTFVPSDSSCSAVLGKGRDAVFRYQYHLEFYHLPKNMAVAGFRNTPKPPYYPCFQILSHYNWKPFKACDYGPLCNQGKRRKVSLGMS